MVGAARRRRKNKHTTSGSPPTIMKSLLKMRSQTMLAVCLSILALPGGAIVARAHDPGLSVATAQLSQQGVSIHLAMSRTDAEQIVPLDADRDGKISGLEWQSASAELRRKARGCFEITCQDQALTSGDATIQRDDRDGLHFDATYSGATGGPLKIRSLWLSELARGHRQYLSVKDEAGRVVSEQMLDADHNTVEVPLATPAGASRHSFKEFFCLGVEHIATGYDHLLFLFGLLMVGGSLRSALKIITSFTVAHSITLALATLNIIHLSSRIVEPMIAASIVYVGVENLLRRNQDNRWKLTFCFGLIHGCGFASALRDLGIGATGTPILLPLVSFNLGVETGQLCVAALVLPLIWKLRSSPSFLPRLVPLGSTVVVLAGGYWLLQRTLL